jgi:hypothetical protein
MFEAELASAKLKEFALPLLHEENEDGGEEFFERDPRLTYIVRWVWYSICGTGLVRTGYLLAVVESRQSWLPHAFSLPSPSQT